MATISKAWSVGNIPKDHISVVDYGAVGNDSVDDTASFTNAFAAGAGKIIFCDTGKTYRVTSELVLPANTVLDLNGSTLKFVITGAANCLLLRDNCLVTNGTITLAGSSYSGHGGNGCPIVIGDYGAGTSYSNIEIRNLTITSNKPGGGGIMTTGASHNITIDNVKFPSSATLGSCISAHWGGSTAPTSGTFHPHNIKISNIKVGNLTYNSVDTSAIFLSSAYNIEVENVDIDQVQYGKALYIWPGDYGAQYAGTAATKIQRGISVSNVTSNGALVGLYTTSRNLLGTVATIAADINIKNSYFKGYDDTNVNCIGLNLASIDGLHIENTVIDANQTNIQLSGVCNNVWFNGNKIKSSYARGVSFNNSSGSYLYTNITFENNEFDSNNTQTSAGRGDIVASYARQLKVINNRFSSALQTWAFRADNTCQQILLAGNHTAALVSGGVAYSIGVSTDYSIRPYGRDNTAVSGITVYGGVPVLSTLSLLDFGGIADGVTDNSSAIAAAWTYLAAGGSLFIPKGTWYFGSTVTVPSNVTLYGEGSASNMKILGSIATNGGSNITIRDLRFEAVSGNTATFVLIRNGGENVQFINNNVFIDDISFKDLMIINGTADSASTRNVLVQGNTFYRRQTTNDGNADTKGIRCRMATADQALYETFDIRFIGNRIYVDAVATTGGDVGIETWARGTIISNNHIFCKNLNGGASGVTVGNADHTVVSDNYIYGYVYGVELGNNTIGNVTVTGNVLYGCRNGIVIGTGGVEKIASCVGNYVVFDDALGLAYQYGIYTQAINTTISGNSILHINTATPFTFSDTASRQYTAIYTDTSTATLTVTGNTIHNFSTGVRSAATSPVNTITGNTFNNVSHPISDSGGTPINIFTGNSVYNFYQLYNNGKTVCVGNSFKRHSSFVLPSGATLSNSPFIASTSGNTSVTNIGNFFENVAESAFASDAAYAVGGTGYTRPDVEKRSQFWRVTNVSTWADVKTEILKTEASVPFDVPIQTWSTNYTFIKRQSVKNADIVDGSDVVENWGP